MRKFTLFIIFVLSVISCSRLDQVWEELREHEERIERLEAECLRLNSNIEALQAVLEALQANDYITAITKIEEGGVEIGYSITFAKSGTVNIYHGADGADGGAPKIGIRKAADGEYYWTSDDEWLTDEQGEKIPVSVQDDKNITPQFRVAEGIWYISYDGGNTWRECEQEAEDDALFSEVTYDEHFVYLKLQDGTVLTVPRSDGTAQEKKVDLVMFMGQSNMVGRGTAAKATVVAKDHGYEFKAISDPTKLYHTAEPFGLNEDNQDSGVTDAGRTGSLVSAFMEEYYKYRGVPIVGVSCSKGGTGTDFWAPGGSALNDAIARHDSAKAWLQENGYTIERDYMVWLQGETDAGKGMSASKYAEKLTAIIEEMILKAGIEFCAVIRIGHYKPSATRNKEIIRSQTDLCKVYDKAVMVSAKLAGYGTSSMPDNSHFKQEVYNELGADAGKHTAYYINNGLKPYMYDPEYDNYFPYGTTSRIWSVSTQLGYGAEYVGVRQVVDGEMYSGVIQLADGYRVSSYIIKMGNTDIVPTVEDDKMLIDIASVSDDIKIIVNTSDGEEEDNKRVYTIGETLQFNMMEEVAPTKITGKYYAVSEGTPAKLTISTRSGYRGWKNIPLYAGEQYQLNPKSSLVIFYDSNDNVISQVNIRNTYPSDGIMPVIEQDCFMSIAVGDSFIPNDEDCTIVRIR